MAGKGGGAWKVAYADFVTAMMAFFMVMWLTAQSEEVKEAVAEHFREPPGAFGLYDKFSGYGDKKDGRTPAPRIQKFTPHRLDLEETPESAVPRIIKAIDQNEQHVGMVLAFAEESAELDERAQTQLREFAVLAAGKRQRIEIRGHASRRPLSSACAFRDAWQLSYGRCVAAMEFLDKQGIPRDRMRLSQAGPSEQLSAAITSVRDLKSARVEIFLLAELAQDWDAARSTEGP